MARKATAKNKKTKGARSPGTMRRVAQGIRRWLRRGILWGAVALVIWIVLYGILPVPTTPYILAERARLGSVERSWVAADGISVYLMRAAVAAEDANFCLHWGFDMNAIRAAIADGAARGGSTISQQTVKNAFLWHGRSWLRKGLEAVITPLVELIWTKRRVLEVYLNVAEFAPGVFGAEAAARHHFGVSAAELSPRQAALLAAVLPNPAERDAGAPSAFVRQRADRIAQGAALIASDGRDACFVD